MTEDKSVELRHAWIGLAQYDFEVVISLIEDRIEKMTPEEIKKELETFEIE